MKAKAIIITVLIMLLFTIIVQNTEVVSFKLFFWEFSMSRIIWLLLVFVIGFILGYTIRTIRDKTDF
jgi:uncharacterized integral membrane protein